MGPHQISKYAIHSDTPTVNDKEVSIMLQNFKLIIKSKYTFLNEYHKNFRWVEP